MCRLILKSLFVMGVGVGLSFTANIHANEHEMMDEGSKEMGAEHHHDKMDEHHDEKMEDDCCCCGFFDFFRFDCCCDD